MRRAVMAGAAALALTMSAGGAELPEPVVKLIRAAAEKRPKIFIRFMGRSNRVELTEADEKGIGFNLMGQHMRRAYGKMSPAEVLSASRKALAAEDASGWLAVLAYAGEHGMKKEFDDLLQDAPTAVREKAAALAPKAAPPAPPAPLANGAAPATTNAPERSKPSYKPKYVIDDFKLYPVPKAPIPKKGERFVDPVFGTRIVRVTDRQVDGYHKGGAGRAGGMTTFYSRMDCDNADSSYILLHSLSGGGPWHLYDGRTFKYLKALPIRSGWAEPRWDWADPKTVYYVDGLKLMKLNVDTGTATALKDFSADVPGAKKVWTQHEGDSSVDGSKWALKTARDWVWYDHLTGKVNVKKGAPSSDHVSTSMLGGFYTVGGDRGNQGIFSLTPDFSSSKKVAPTGAHSDLAVDARGRDVLVYVNNKIDWIEMVDLATGKVTKLISVVHKTNWKDLIAGGGGKHISGNCVATPGWVLVSTYGGSPFVIKSWQHQSVYMLELKANPRVWRVAHTHCPWDKSKGKDYWSEALATINTQGTRVYWGTNWDKPAGARTIETVFAELPSTWYEDLMGKAGARAARAATRSSIARSLGEASAAAYDKLIGRASSARK